MDIDLWRKRLSALPLGELYLYPELGSTNQVAQDLVFQGAPHLSLVLADAQTSGRGRLGRTWVTRPGKALAFSLILHPGKDHPGGRLEALSGLGALALVEVLQVEYQLPAQIKWPNDVLVDGKKVAGILVELHWSGPEVTAAVIGVGVNVLQGSVPDPGQLSFPAVSLEECLGASVSRLDLLLLTLQGMIKWYPRLAEQDFLSRWDSSLAYKGKQVCLLVDGSPVARGELVGLADNGRLVLRSEEEGDRLYTSGEIQLRPVDRS